MTAAPDRPDFAGTLEDHGLEAPRRARPHTLQVNIGLRCNLACHHCHVESGPKRREAMGEREIDRVIELLRRDAGLEVLDLTGGAPELHPEFRRLVRAARDLGRRVIDRCNLTVLLESGQESTATFLANHEVAIVASLPCTTRSQVEAQRGRGVFDPSIAALRRLNALGYGKAGSHLALDLVYNPGGPFLPPPQQQLEERYRRELRERFGIEFHRLITITNMPIKRFAHELARDGHEDTYLQLLEHAFNPATLDGLMCRTTVSVDHRGRLYDCDFNLALGLRVPGAFRTIFDVDDLGALEGDAIAGGPHCLGCTAGAGSSCGGALVEASARARGERLGDHPDA